MPLFELTQSSLVEIPTTTFATEQVFERPDLQRHLRNQIKILAPDVLIVAEEFSAFAGSKRRIDLLGVDRDGYLVVFELKRTQDGGHLELQALRYAAMVSEMEFEDMVDHYAHYLGKTEPEAVDQARSRLADWLEDAGGVDTKLKKEVRLILVAPGFDPEITTTVLWLRNIYKLDIRCISFNPYKLDNRILISVEQVIPLAEANDLMIQLRKRQDNVLPVKTTGADWTPYIVITPGGRSEPLRKRRAILAMVQALAAAGTCLPSIAEVLTDAKMMHVPGTFDGDELYETLVSAYPTLPQNKLRWFLEAPIHGNGDTWVLSKMWGTQTEQVLKELVAIAPTGGFSFEPATPNLG